MNFRYILFLFFFTENIFGSIDQISEFLISTVPFSTNEFNASRAEMVPYRSGKLPIKEKGYYFLQGNITPDFSRELNSLLITPSAYPYYVYINGKEVFRWGFGENSKFKSNYNAEVINIELLLNKDSENQILFCLYTDGEKTPLPNFYTGDFTELSNKAYIQTLFNQQIIMGLVVCALFAAILFLGYFLISGKREQEVLYFVLTSIFFVVAYLNIFLSSQIFDELTIVKISRFSLLMIPFFLLRFIQSYTGLFKKFIYLFWIPLIIAFSAGLYMIFLKERNELNEFFIIMQIGVAIPELVAVLILLLIDFRYNSRKDKYIIYLGFIVLTITALRDIYYSTNSLIPYVWIIPYGFFTQLFTIALSITVRQRAMYVSTLDYKNKLENANIQIKKEAVKRERFLDTVASELRSPMNGLEERVLDMEKEKDPSFNSMSGAFRRIRITLNNIFDYVAVRDGQLRILDYDFDLYTTLDILNGFYFEMAKKKSLTFSMMYDKKFIPRYMHGDKEHLVQVMDNLLQNAIKYTRDGGVSCSISYRNSELIFSVSDTGEGINEEGKNAFRKAISTDQYFSFSEKYEGVGLGLAITDMIVRKMHGRINLESYLEQGTIILVTIPLKEKKEITTEEEKEVGAKVLVVEDNKVNAMIISKLLKKSGYEYKVVENGLLAVKEAKENRYETILMDVEMPVMDGLEATRKIRLFDPRTPIIAVTANGNYSDCIEAGMNDHLMKPVNFEYLKEILRKYAFQKIEA